MFTASCDKTAKMWDLGSNQFVQVAQVSPGLEMRVVLWPQSTRTSGGPPDSATWWSGGLLETFSH